MKRKPENRLFQIGDKVMLDNDLLTDDSYNDFYEKELLISEYVGVDKSMRKAEMYRLKTKDGIEVPNHFYHFEIFSI